MRDELHPDNFRKVIFHDTTSGERFLFKSTVETDETAEWEDGEEYPLTRTEMSSASHPFYTGVEKVVDTAGRVEKFKARFEKSQEKQENQNNEGKDQTESSDDQKKSDESTKKETDTDAEDADESQQANDN